MCLTSEQAVQRAADHENVVDELVIHLRVVKSMLQVVCVLINDQESRRIAMVAVRDAEAAIAKATGA